MYMKIKKFNDVYKRFLILFIKLCREVLFEINTIINCTKKSKLLKKIRIFPCSLLPISRMEEKRKIQITDLPVDIFILISLFVSVNKLTSTCRDLFFGVKPHLYLYWRLNTTHSLKYYEDEAFRALVHSRIENISLQLSLNLSGCYGITDVSALGGVHTLDLSNCHGITDVSDLCEVHTLILRYCYGITDVRALGGVHTLDLSGCRGITDVRALSGVHTLIFERFRNLGCHRSW